MRSMEFLTLLGELDDDVLTAKTAPALTKSGTKKRRRTLTALTAACLCLCVLGASAWFFIPPNTSTTDSAKYVTIRLDNRLASYRVINTKTLSRFERLRLPDTPGEVLCTHGENVFYRAEGEEDLTYIIQKRGDDSYVVLEFGDYISTMGIDMRESYWYTEGWLTDEDIAALNGAPISYDEDILRDVYGVDSAKDIVRIKFEKADFDNSSVGRSVKIKSVTVKDEETVAVVYGLLTQMEALPVTADWPLTRIFSEHESYLKGETPLSIQTDRKVTVTLQNGRELEYFYSPVDRLLCSTAPLCAYTVTLTEAENDLLIRVCGIDLTWQDHGRIHQPEGNQVASPEIATETTATMPPKNAKA